MVLVVTAGTNLISQAFSVLVTFFKRESWLWIFLESLESVDDLIRNFGVHFNSSRLRASANATCLFVLIYHAVVIFQYRDMMTGNSQNYITCVLYYYWICGATLSTFDLVFSMIINRQIFEEMRGIPRGKYSTEMLLTFFQAVDLLDDISQCHGLRECINIGNQFLNILAYLFVLVYQVDRLGTTDTIVVFCIISVLPRVFCVIALAISGSMLNKSVT